MGRLLQCAVVPKDEVHPELWVGANKKFRKVPRARLEKVRNDKVSLFGRGARRAGEGEWDVSQQPAPRRPEPRPRRVVRGRPRSSQIRLLAQLGSQLVCPISWEVLPAACAAGCSAARRPQHSVSDRHTHSAPGMPSHRGMPGCNPFRATAMDRGRVPAPSLEPAVTATRSASSVLCVPPAFHSVRGSIPDARRGQRRSRPRRTPRCSRGKTRAARRSRPLASTTTLRGTSS
jgi:hypothetical protein